MNDEKLILHVREYSFLYDIGDPRYSNQPLRDKSWHEIGNKMGCKGVHCKNRWKALRDCYRKSLKSRVLRTGLGPSCHRLWKFEKQMEFLKQHMIYQPEGSTDDITSEADQEAFDIVDTRESFTTETPPTKRKQPMTQFSVSASEFNNGCNRKRHKMDKPADHLSAYFASVEETVRTFPLALQIRIKSQISNILHHAELEAITFPSFVPTLQQTNNSTAPSVPELNSPNDVHEFEFAEITKSSPKYSDTDYP